MGTKYKSELLRYLKLARAWQPLSLRGFICAIAGAWCLYALAIPESDLIAFITGGAVLGLTILSLLTALLIRGRLRKNLQIRAIFNLGDNIAGQEIPAGIVVQGSALPPFFTLEITRVFDHSGAFSRTHIISGAESQRQLVDSIIVPHRGVWQLREFRLVLRDALGLACIQWSIPDHSSTEVSAKTLPIRPLPIMAASSRAGDQLNNSQERSGDLFDIKAYDPSDGINRVLWKTFARSGQLVVRRPEPAIIPEGEVAIYVVASAEEDYVVGAFLSYLEELERGNITVIFGTDGLRESAHSDLQSSSSYVTRPSVIRSALNRTVWQSDTGTGRGISAYLSALEDQKRRISRLIVFGPENRESWFHEVSRATAINQVAINAIIVPETIDAMVDFYGSQEQHSLGARARSLLEKVRPPTAPRSPRVFAESTADVILCQRGDIIL